VSTAGRTSRRFRTLAKNPAPQRRPCCICHQPIDYTLVWPQPQSFSVQRLKSWNDHPHAAMTPATWRLPTSHVTAATAPAGPEARAAPHHATGRPRPTARPEGEGVEKFGSEAKE